MKTRRALTSYTLALALAGSVAPAFADGEGHEHHGTHAVAEHADGSYAAAVAAIETHAATIASMIEAGKLDSVHEEAAPVIELSGTLAKLASQPGSGIERGQLKDVNLAAKKLGEIADELHEAADAGETQKSRDLSDQLQAQIGTLAAMSSPAAHHDPELEGERHEHHHDAD